MLGLAAVLITTSGEMRALVFLFAFCVAISIGVVLLRSVDHRHEAAEHKQEEQSMASKQEESSGDQGRCR